MRKLQAFVVVVTLILAGAIAFGETVELNWYWCCGQQDRLDMNNALAREFEAANPGVKVNSLFPGNTGTSSYYERVIVGILGGAGPDVFWLGGGFWQLADMGLLMPLQDVIAQDASLRTIDKSIIAANNWMGNTLGITYGININAVFYNKTMFDQTGLKVPNAWTWEGLISTGKKLTTDVNGDGTKDTWGFGFEGGDPWWFYSYGSLPYNSTGTQMTINNPENAAGLGIMAEIMTRGEVHPVYGQGFSPFTLFKDSKLAMSVDGPYSMPEYAKTNLDWNLAPMPALSFGDRTIKVDVMTPESYAIGANTKHPKEAIALLKFITSKSSMLKYANMGTIIPTLPAALPTFVAKGNNINRRVFIEAIPTLTRYVFEHPAWSSMEKSANAYRSKVYAGQMAPAAALGQIETEANGILADYWAKRK